MSLTKSTIVKINPALKSSMMRNFHKCSTFLELMDRTSANQNILNKSIIKLHIFKMYQNIMNMEKMAMTSPSKFESKQTYTLLYIQQIVMLLNRFTV